MGSGLESCDRAEQACLVFLGKTLDLQVGDGKDLSIDDWIEPDLVNKGVFSISGGPEQVQNYGVAAPGPGWYGYGLFMMQFETRPDATAVRGKLQKSFPPRLANGCLGLQPNVNNFEIMEHPELFSTLFSNEDGEIVGRVFTLRVRFRVVYSNTT